MRQELAALGLKVSLFGLNEKMFANETTVSKACDFPILNDTATANVYGLLNVPNKDFVYIWNKQGDLVSLYPPWQITLTKPLNYDKLKNLLADLAK
jgi:hypothetical protein